MMEPHEELDEMMAELQSIYQRAKGGEKGKRIYRDIMAVRARLEDIAAALEDAAQ